MHMVNYRRNQELVMQTPPSIPVAFTPQAAAARRVIDEALGTGRTILSEPEAKAVLAAYGVPVVETRVAAGAEEAVRVANELGYPVAVKIVSAELTHKSDVGGVALDLEQPDAVSRAVAAIIERIARQRPDAHITGFAVQRMARRPGAVELIVGVATDPLFGPVILFGQGGTAVEVIADRALALPPLNMHLARELISRTHVFKLLQGYRDRPAADLDAICLTLIQVSQLIVDMAELAELDINPLYADAGGVLALDARIRLAPGSVPGTARLAIRPYPQELEEYVRLPAGRRIFLRPIRPEDEAAHQAFLNRLTPDDKRFRFFGAVREFSHLQLARFTQNDYDREMAFIATVPDESGRMETVGVVRSVSDPDNVRAEFAIVVRSDLKRQGLGRALMDKMIRYCRGRGLRELWGQVLVGNEAMLHLARSCGFTQRALPQDGAFEVVLQLDAR
jgi:acetyltransferase